MPDLSALARLAGLCPDWIDADGVRRFVAPDDLGAILTALALPAESDAQRRVSADRLRFEAEQVPPLITADMGTPVRLPPALASHASAELTLDGGGFRAFDIVDGHLPSIENPGYHNLHIGSHQLMLAVAPRRCAMPPDDPDRLWGPVVQIPSLRGVGAFGSLDDLRLAALAFAREGAHLIALSPMHALMPDATGPFSPYAPSSRMVLNSALATPPLENLAEDLIDWQQALPDAFNAQRRVFRQLSEDARADVRGWAARQSSDLIRHATFEAIARSQAGRPWQAWPEAYRDPASSAVTDFARDHADEIEFHLFGQMIASQTLARTQADILAGGMAVGLISDLAVGVHPGGSDVWANTEAFLRGVTIGAPPDPLGPEGQNWGLTAFSPPGLRAQGFAPWIALLRTMFAIGGGVRIDHAFGLQRLWVIPDGAPSARGAYLTYPIHDLMRLLAIESNHARSIVIGEDLGTMPPGFAEIADRYGLFGMKVLFFERSKDGQFKDTRDYARQSVAMTSTHDTPTIAGWWQGRDLEKERVGNCEERDERMRDRTLLWSSLGEDQPLPDADRPSPVVDAVIKRIGQASSRLKVIPLEDLVGQIEQVNVPGTVDEQPNWRRRMPETIEKLLGREDVAKRLQSLSRPYGSPIDKAGNERQDFAGQKADRPDLL